MGRIVRRRDEIDVQRPLLLQVKAHIRHLIHRNGHASAPIGDHLVLAVHASQRAVREEHGAAAARAADRRLLPHVQCRAGNHQLPLGPARAALAGSAIDAARPRAQLAASQRFFELHSRPFPASLRDCASKTARTRHCLLRRSARPANRRPSRPADETDPHRATRLCGARLRHRSDQANAQSSTPSKRTRNAQPGTQRAACVGNCALPSSRATTLRALMRHSIALYGQDA